MSVQLIQDKLANYQCSSEQEESLALKEMMQEIALAALSRGDFFKRAAFQGGTCLRIFHGVQRFSEDLDFILTKPEKNFQWDSYLKAMEMEFKAFGLDLKVEDRSKAEGTIKKAFLKDDSFGKVLILKHRPRDRKPKMIKIKFELDTNPPLGSEVATRYLDFPFVAAVTTQDLPSLFAGKSHALLCRVYPKGRDWYDFTWYVGQKTKLNWEFLSHACDQQGPWQGQKMQIKKDWYLEEVGKKIQSLDWKQIKEDVARFLRPRELSSLEIWNKDFFFDRLDKLREYL